jgi:hypothetical protein
MLENLIGPLLGSEAADAGVGTPPYRHRCRLRNRSSAAFDYAYQDDNEKKESAPALAGVGGFALRSR